jgi:hypothetical protein
MIDLIVKLLVILFTLAVGTCFTFWPEAMVHRFDRWSGRTVRPAVDQGLTQPAVIALRQMGVLLITLACSAIYLWIREG